MGEKGKKPLNIIIFLLDTMREDGIGVYNQKADTKSMNEFAADSVVYHNTISPSSWTLPSHVSLFTGLYPSEHKIDTDTMFKNTIRNSNQVFKRFLPRRLSEIGYHTIGFSTNPIVTREYQFDTGFEKFVQSVITVPNNKTKLFEEFGDNDYAILKTLVKKLKFGKLIEFYKLYREEKRFYRDTNFPYEKGADNIIENLDQLDLNEPFFLFMNLMEMHEPYPNVGLSTRDKLRCFVDLPPDNERKAKVMTQDYLRQSEVIDRKFAEVISILRNKDVYDNSLIIITSDHGQSLGTDGWFLHQHLLNDELIRIPLIIKYPYRISDMEESDKCQNYHSLIDLYDLIMKVAEGHDVSLSSRNIVFSEVSDSSNTPSLEMKKNYDLVDFNGRVKHLLSPKKAMYYSGFKIIVEGPAGFVYEFTKDHKPISVKDNMENLDYMLTQLEIFTGASEFSIPNARSVSQRDSDFGK